MLNYERRKKDMEKEKKEEKRKNKIMYLVFGSGGLNGFCYIGILKELELNLKLKYDKPYLKLIHYIKGLAGTSIGSVVCLFLLLNYSLNEIVTFCKLYMKTNNQININLDVSQIFKKLGLMEVDILKKFIQSIIYHKLDKYDLKMNELYEFSRIPFYFSTYNITLETGEMLNYKQNISVVDAIVASCCIPLVFTPYDIGGYHYADGCLHKNLPTDLFPFEETLFFRIKHNSNFKQDYINYFVKLCRIKDKDGGGKTFSKKQLISIQCESCLHDMILNNFYISDEKIDQLVHWGRQNYILNKYFDLLLLIYQKYESP